MAYKYCSIFAFLLILNILLSEYALARREIPKESKSKSVDVKHPESFIDHDGTVLIPGLGRYYIKPRPGSHFGPTYNPVTGTSGAGNGLVTPGSGFFPGIGGRSFIPGGDDTPIPNPGVEVPIPGGGSGGVPATPSP